MGTSARADWTGGRSASFLGVAATSAAALLRESGRRRNNRYNRGCALAADERVYGAVLVDMAELRRVQRVDGWSGCTGFAHSRGMGARWIFEMISFVTCQIFIHPRIYLTECIICRRTYSLSLR